MAREDSHHVMLRMDVDGVTTLVTRVSHGVREIDSFLAGLMARQCALRPREFWELVDCTLDSDGWLTLVRERCEGGRNPFLGRG